MSSRSETTTSRTDVLMDILMFLVAAWGIAYSDGQTQAAVFGFFCGSNLVFAMTDYRDYLKQKLEELRNAQSD